MGLLTEKQGNVPDGMSRPVNTIRVNLVIGAADPRIHEAIASTGGAWSDLLLRVISFAWTQKVRPHGEGVQNQSSRQASRPSLALSADPAVRLTNFSFPGSRQRDAGALSGAPEGRLHNPGHFRESDQNIGK